MPSSPAQYRKIRRGGELSVIGKETHLFEPGPQTAEITVTDSRPEQWLIIRNTNVGPSRVTVNAVRTFVVPPPAEPRPSGISPLSFHSIRFASEADARPTMTSN